MVHVIQNVLVPTRHDEIGQLVSVESHIMPYLKQALSRVFIHEPTVYFSQRLLSRQAFPQLFTKLDDGTLCLKEQEAYYHFHQKTNVYHLIPAESDAHSSKDVQRQLKLNLFDS